MAENKSIRSRVIGASFWAIAGTSCGVIIGIVRVPLVLNYLGSERMGLWRIAVSTTAMLTFLRAGLLPHLKTSMAEAYAERDQDKFNSYSSTAMFLALCFLVLGLVLGAGTYLIDWVRVFNVKGDVAKTETSSLMMILVAMSLFTFGGSFVASIYDAMLDVVRTQKYLLIGTVSGFGCLLLGILLKTALPVLVVLASLPMILCYALLYLRLYIRSPEIVHINVSRVKRMLSGLLKPSLYCVSIQLTSAAMQALPPFFIATYLSLENVTTFSVAQQLISYPLVVLSSIMPVFWPAFTVSWKRGQRKLLRRRIILALVTTALFMLLLSVCFGLFGNWFILFWTRGKINATPSLLLLLSLAAMVMGCIYWSSTFLWSINQLRLLLLSSIGTVSVFAVAVFLFINKNGMEGVAMSLLIGNLIGGLLPMLWGTFSKLGNRFSSTDSI